MAPTDPDNDLSRAQWRKSSYSNGGEGACIEIAIFNNTVAVRDSKNPTDPNLVLDFPAWTAFAKRIKHGIL